MVGFRWQPFKPVTAEDAELAEFITAIRRSVVEELNARSGGWSLMAFDVRDPVGCGLTNAIHIDAERAWRRGREVAGGTLHHGKGAGAISGRKMVKGDCDLNETLHRAAMWIGERHGPPKVLEHFVCLEVVPAINQVDASDELGLVHEGIVACKRVVSSQKSVVGNQ